MEKEILEKKLKIALQKASILENMIENTTRELYQKENKLLAREKDLLKQKDELEKTQEQLIRAERLSIIGQMSAGIAHELNNPMMGILNYIQYCLKHTPENDNKYSILQDAIKEINRCIKIVKDILFFSHPGLEMESGYEKKNCNIILDNALNLLSYRITEEKVFINKHGTKGLPEIWMKANNIEQVFVNLINNALDALKESNKKEIDIDLSQKDKFVQITITDTGCGISKESLHRIFDPFFTTKPVGKGTGLGLGICHNIIKVHGGSIFCESKLGIGTKFTILLPIERRKH
ncbi:MAG: GHKL domain-containing protein [Candidatus Melainabacteria bacterium]|nr:GHKL domain-containing protein [Candidatus Melainabacteria bacterium]